MRLAENRGVDADLSLYNRVGDLLLKTRQTQHAVEYWERGVDAYMEAGFYNNAIALCNKIVRTAPGRNSIYLKLGQISARKGFLSDARKNILEYAQRMQRAGQIDEAFRALQKFADLQPEPEIRLMLADQLLAHKRLSAGVDQLRYAWRDLVSQGRQADAEEIRSRILELAPDRDPEVDKPEGARPPEVSDLDAEGIIDLPELEPEYPEEERAAVGTAPRAEAPPAPAKEEKEKEEAEEGAAAEEALEIGDLGTAAAQEVEGLEVASPDVEAAEEAPAPSEELTLEDLGLRPVGAETTGPSVEPEIEPIDIEPTAFEFDVLGAEGLALGSVELESLEEKTEERDEDAGPVIEVPEGLTFDLGDFDLEAVPAREGEEGPLLSGLDFDADLTPLETAEPPPAEVAGDLPVLEPIVEPEPGAEPAAPLPAESVEAYREFLREDPENHDLRTRLAELLLEEGRRPEALRELRRALEGYESQGKIREAEFVGDELLRLSPNDVRVHQKRVELAFLQQEKGRLIQAYLDLADCLDRTEASEKARAVYERVLELDPGNERATRALESMGVGTAPAGAPEEESVSSIDEFVNLGAVLRSEQKPASTRFQVRVTEPGAEDEFDFAEMLAQFRAKVAEAVTPEDYESHYDLGIAYKEMGLVDEAISEFQIAQRSEDHRLRAQEMLGRCFLEKGEYKVAQKVLLRALQAGGPDDALVAVYYDLGRVHEALGEPQRALEFYERALGVDINFRDVSGRVRALRKKA